MKNKEIKLLYREVVEKARDMDSLQAEVARLRQMIESDTRFNLQARDAQTESYHAFQDKLLSIRLDDEGNVAVPEKQLQTAETTDLL